MNISIDLRSLHSSEFSGVESYTVNMLEQLLLQDRENKYTLFYNGFNPQKFDFLHFINAQYIQTRVPNRLLNLALKFVGKPKLEKLIGDTDVLFLPNWNMVAIEPSTKLILTIHDLSPIVTPHYYNLKARLWHKFINIEKLVKRADKIITVSNFTKTSLVEVLKVDPSKIVVAPLGVDSHSYRANLEIPRLREVRNNYGLPGDFFLFTGTLEPRKNLLGLIEAFEQVDSESHLVISGKLGWKYGSILRKINSSPKKRLIKLLGYIPESDKPYIMKLAKVFVWPSFYEGFGLPPLEAMSVGTPVITSQLTSLPEVVEDAALLINPYNTGDLAEAMKEMESNESLRKEFVQKGLVRAQNFQWQKTASVVKSVIDSI